MLWRKNKIRKKDLKCQGKEVEISERMAKNEQTNQNKKHLTWKITFGGKNPEEWTMHYLGAKHSRQNSKCKVLEGKRSPGRQAGVPGAKWDMRGFVGRVIGNEISTVMGWWWECETRSLKTLAISELGNHWWFWAEENPGHKLLCREQIEAGGQRQE